MSKDPGEKSESYDEPTGVLYVVATPIGNLGDISQRALDTLREVDLILCEDTRHTRKLLTRYGIETRTSSYHDHNERSRTPALVAQLESGAQKNPHRLRFGGLFYCSITTG